jgi:sulfhydrogenase subunit beta (sulfur reductase)
MPVYGPVPREEISTWLDTLMDQGILIAPQDIEGALLYRPVSASSCLVWETTRPVTTIKEFFFPPMESLLKIEIIGGHVNLQETIPLEKQVIFGVRPCEARGIRILDALFLEDEPIDPYYAERRKNTALIGLACKELGDSCFCTSLGGAPDDPKDMDVMLYEMGEDYAVEVVTEKGSSLIGRVFDSLPVISKLEWNSAAENRLITNWQVPDRESWPTLFDDPYWENLADRCLSCRICAYVCPTCRCFDVRDEINGDGSIERLRCWDSCTGVNYRRIAGGHNPRPSKGERLRNRFFCKFYYYPEQYGLMSSACTGCGRCIDYCPVGIDLTEVLGRLSGLVVEIGESGEN